MNLKKKIKKYILAFTLVELIVVITIIAILGTIILMSFLWHTKNARNVVRISDMWNISKGIELFILKTWTPPSPDFADILSGGWERSIIQWVVGNLVSSNIGVFGDLVDPDSEKEYIYSVFSRSKYYQIQTEFTDKSTGVFNSAYADSEKVIVRGNYIFDPSLPSLILVKNSVWTWGIFDPNVCFIVDGWINTRDICREKKTEMIMKQYDARLLAYRDMETYVTVWGMKYLKDFSWNNNNWLFTGWLDPSLSGSVIDWKLWKSLTFNGDGNYIKIVNSTSLNPEHISFSATVKHYWNGIKSNYRPRMFSKWSDLGSNEQYSFYNNFNGGSANIFQINLGTEVSGGWVVYWEKSYGDLINNFYHVTGVYDWKDTKIFVNGKLDNVSSDTFSGKILPSTKDLIIWNSAWPHWYSRAFYWLIDDVKIYETPLTDMEILQQAKIAGF